MSVDYNLLGYDPGSDRSRLDDVSSMLVIPNPSEEVQHDGHIQQWSFFARAKGPVMLQVFLYSIFLIGWLQCDGTKYNFLI